MEETTNESTVQTDESGMNEFMSSLTGNDYQTDAENTEDTNQETENTDATDGTQEASEEDKTEENPTDENTPDAENEQSGEQEQLDNKPQTFKIKVNKEEREVTLDEMTALAQKGSDYDRVRNQRDQLQQEINSYKQKDQEKEKFHAALAQLEKVSKRTNTPVETLALALRKSVLKNSGVSPEAIDATIKAEDMEAEMEALKNQPEETPALDENELRAQRETEEFQLLYPDVEITKEDAEAMTPDIQAGARLVNAYQKCEIAKKNSEIARLNDEIKKLNSKLKGEERNRKNHYASPGSMSDSGGTTQLSEIDKFMAAMMKP